MWSSVTGSVDGYPIIAVPTESPTRMASTPDSSTRRPKSASYAVITTSFSPVRLCSAKSRTVTGRSCFSFLANARAPQRSELPQPEVTIGELGVRHCQSRFAHGLILEEHDVEIESARTPARRAYPSCLRFDSLERSE